MKRLLGLFVIAALGCKPRGGSACNGNEVRCMDGKTVLVCVDGHFVQMGCPGPKGCEPTKSSATCDGKGSAVGDPCAPDWIITCANRETQLVCEKGKFTAFPCRGMGGCYEGECSQSLAEPGDRCHAKNEAACSVDGTARLHCVDGKMVKERSCRGPKKCQVGPKKKNCDPNVPKDCDIFISCDDSSRVADETCTEGAACTMDGTGMLECREGKLVLTAKCRGPKGCYHDTLMYETLHCDSTVGRVGDPCDAGAYACSEDGRAALECKNGSFAAKRTNCKCSSSMTDAGLLFDCK